MSDITDNFSVPTADCLVTPRLDQAVLNQIQNHQLRKIAQARDKDLLSVQKTLLSVAGPLCCLHDTLASGKEVSSDEINNILEQTLCLLGSTNFQLSAVRRRRVLANINTDKVDLAYTPLPNAKRMLFGEDFPSIASKQADLSKGLSKSLNTQTKRWDNRRYSTNAPQGSRQPNTQGHAKYQNNRSKNYRPFRADKNPRRESTGSYMSGNK